MTISDGYEEVVSTNVQQMVDSWQGTLDMTGGEIWYIPRSLCCLVWNKLRP